MTSSDPKWTYVGYAHDGKEFLLDGVNVWDHKWTLLRDRARANVKDPLYGQSFQFEVYEIVVSGRHIVFAAGEFSNCIWGFYQE